MCVTRPRVQVMGVRHGYTAAVRTLKVCIMGSSVLSAPREVER